MATNYLTSLSFGFLIFQQRSQSCYDNQANPYKAFGTVTDTNKLCRKVSLLLLSLSLLLIHMHMWVSEEVAGVPVPEQNQVGSRPMEVATEEVQKGFFQGRSSTRDVVLPGMAVSMSHAPGATSRERLTPWLVWKCACQPNSSIQQAFISFPLDLDPQRDCILRNSLGLSSVIKVEPQSSRIRVLIKESREHPSCPILWEHREKAASTSQSSLSKSGPGWHLDLGLPSLQNLEKINSCLSYTVYGSLWWQPEQTKKIKCFKYLQAYSPVTCAQRRLKPEVVHETSAFCVGLRRYPQMVHLGPRMCIWGTNIYFEKSVNMFEDGKCSMESSTIKAEGESRKREGTQERKKCQYCPTESRMLRLILALNVFFKNMMAPKTNYWNRGNFPVRENIVVILVI